MMTLRAYAKVNRYLAVLERREQDGYHEVRTLLQAISLHDTVTFEPSTELSLACSDSSLEGEKNLAWKGLRLLSELVELPKLHIHIEKRIPMQAGLGGGSSDTAAVLRGVNQWMGGIVSKDDLMSVAAACGVDVPFFLLETPVALATGRGDVLEAQSPGPSIPIVVAKPNVGCSSSEMYAKLSSMKRTIEQNPREGHNDFTLVAPSESHALMDRLRESGATLAMLCGSGSAVYGMFPTLEDAQRVAREFDVWAVACSTLESYE